MSQRKGKLEAASRLRPGSHAKSTPAATRQEARKAKQPAEPLDDSSSADDLPPTLHPPSIPFRSLKIALAALRDLGALPDQLDRSIWTNRIVSTDRGKTVEAFRFLGLIDSESKPTQPLEALMAALDTQSWSGELRLVLERAYQPLLSGSVSSLTAGGLIRTFRTLYKTPGDVTRKSCNFFVDAAREAALEIGPFLLTNSRSRWIDGQRVDFKDGAASRPIATKTAVEATNAESLNLLVSKFPTYEASWPDDVKRLWFASLNNLIQRLDPDINPD